MGGPDKRLEELRFLTCGSVDDGKSTLIGRLLFDSRQIYEDQLVALTADSKKFGTTGQDIDLALLMDGLEAEREQGITIDVAYRYFSTPRRAFIVADTPGHEQYTRNMATGASNADLAVLLVDARKGVLTQTRRHATICSLLGIKHLLLAVNKIDLADFSQDRFSAVKEEFVRFCKDKGFQSVVAIPISARFGDNVSTRSSKLSWYGGPTLLEYLETIAIVDDALTKPFRMFVQLAVRPHADFRGFAGSVCSGKVRVGDRLMVCSSRKSTTVTGIEGPDGAVAEASCNSAITLTLGDEIDISRGELLASFDDSPELANQFSANLVSLTDDPIIPGRAYQMRIGTRWLTATLSQVKSRLDVDSGASLAAKELHLNEIGVVNLSTSLAIPFDPYLDNRNTGSFILVDQYSHATVAAGMILHSLRRSSNVKTESSLVHASARAAIKGQRPRCIWFTGLPSSGKSTLSKALEMRLHQGGRHTMLLDGDNLRQGINGDLGFTEVDRVENIRRAGHVARLMVDAGLIVICSFISPYRADREMVKKLFTSEEYIEIFVDTPLEECIRRDPKGLYAKALSGNLPGFTGIGSPYERPLQPDLRLSSVHRSDNSTKQESEDIDLQVGKILELLKL